MFPLRYVLAAPFFAYALLPSGPYVRAAAQTVENGVSKLPISADLVLTPVFCATKTKKGSALSGKETFEIGKAACAELEPALKGAFAELTPVAEEPSADQGKVALIPKFVDVAATKTVTAFSNREMVVLLQWTVKDVSGKTVWVETVQGTAKHHMGNAFTYGKNLKRIVNDSVKDAAEQSALKMSSAAELRALATPHAVTDIRAQ